MKQIVKDVITGFKYDKQPCYFQKILYVSIKCYEIAPCVECRAHYNNLKVDYCTLITGRWQVPEWN